jgi:predicted MFS family arabinose efflux permease
MIAALVPNLFVMPVYQALMPIFQKDILLVGPEGLGLLMAAPGLGATLATLTLASFAYRVRRTGVLLVGCLFLMGAFLFLFAWTTALPLAMLTLFGMGAFQITFLTTTNTMLQLMVPDALRGRVMAIYAIDHGLAPAGAMLAGVEAHFLGAPTTVAVAGALVMLLALLVAWRIPQVRLART